MKSSELRYLSSAKMAVAAVCTLFVVEAASEQHFPNQCGPMGGMSEPLCRASIYAVISDSVSYDKRHIQIVGYYSDGGYPLLFVNKDAFEVSDVASSIYLDFSSLDEAAKRFLIDNDKMTVVVEGSYSKNGKETYGVGGYISAGTIAVTLVGRRSGPWGYSQSMPSWLKNKKGKK